MPTTNHARCLSVFVLLLLPNAYAHAQPSDAAFTLTAESLADGKTVELGGAVWRYHAGDDAAWASRDFDESGWTQIESSRLSEADLNSIEWNGRAWFRLRVWVGEDLVNQFVAVRVWHWGASEIYLDGKLLRRFGSIEQNGDKEYNPRGQFVPVVFASAGAHTVAVRYSFQAGDLNSWRGRWLRRGDVTPGFTLAFQSGETATLNLERRATRSRLDYVFIGVLAALALVHLLLFAFYRSAPGNLFYSFFAAALGTVMWLWLVISAYHLDAFTMELAHIAHEDLQSLGVLALLVFLYVEFRGGVSWFFWLLLIVWSVGAFLHFTQLAHPYQFTPAMIVVTLADGLRIMWRALKERRTGARIIAAGIGVFVLCVLVNISVGRKFIQPPEWLYEINKNLTILSIPLVVSLYLARNFARTNKNLESQLIQVQSLSARQLEHERTEADLRLRHEKERAENERRAQELEEARQLQVSMLPKTLPQLSDLEIAVYMKPATEVGGDYYDFHVSEDNTLTAVIGDATGHGLKAGTMVTAMKSLFGTLAPQDDMPHIFNESNRVLKAMKLRGLFMALLMLKVRGDRLTICTAGMPPALIYRVATGEIEMANLRAAPLGSLKQFAYQQQAFAIAPGDCIMLMSDGFPERFNADGEMLGYDKARAVLAEVAGETADEIIKRFVCEGDEWAGAKTQDDDVTFVVLKVKQS